MLRCPVKKPAGKLISGLFLCLCVNSGLANPASPFLVRDQNPFALIYGLPHATAARFPEASQQGWIFSLNGSNQLIYHTSQDAELLVDLETWQLNLFYDHRLKDNLLLRIQLPLIAHGGGFMDAPIDRYHELTGLPRDIRPAFDDDLIQISYSENQDNLLEINQRQKGLGDIALQLGWQADKSAEHALSHWLSLKLPSGNSEKLTGSGGTDLAFWSALDYRLSAASWFYGQAGLLYMSDSEVLQHRHNNWAVFATAGMAYEAWPGIELKAQFDIHSALYDSELKYLSEVIQFTFGGSYRINAQQSVDFAIAEDIQAGASPDVNFNISWWLYY